MTTTLYGIRNCDTVRKARAWLDGRGEAYAFHDFRTQGIDAECLARWCAALGWSQVLNRTGTTFRKLPEAAKADLTEEKAMALMREQPSMIRRPVLEREGAIHAGFDPAQYEALLG